MDRLFRNENALDPRMCGNGLTLHLHRIEYKTQQHSQDSPSATTHPLRTHLN